MLSRVYIKIPLAEDNYVRKKFIHILLQDTGAFYLCDSNVDGIN